MNQVKKTTVSVDALKKAAASSKVFDDVCSQFALRQRTRRTITIHGLQLAMSKEGFKYTREEYKQVLITLSQAGIGKLQMNRNNKVKALTGIEMTLQSIGRAVANNESVLKTTKSPRAKFTELKAAVEKVHKTEMVEKPPKSSTQTTKVPVRKPAPYPTYLTILVEGKPMTIPGPSNVTPENLTDLLIKFKQISSKNDAEI